MTEVAVGVDIGGTSSRALAVASTGAVAGRGAAGGGNPNSHPPEVAAARVASAVEAAVPPGAEVVACLLGMAGESKVVGDPAVVALFETALRGVGVACAVHIVSDAEVAFASATSAPAGTVVIGGTGSVAARIADRRKTSWFGGWGWLLGDEGSAYWIGRQAVRSVLRLLQGDGDLGPFEVAVLAEAFGTADPPADVAGRRLAVQRLITAANAAPPIHLARYAALVSTHADDPAAAAIVAAAADLLAEHAHATRRAGETTPIVLAGSVIGPESPVGLALRARLSPEAEVLFAPDGATGAAWLAALRAWGPDTPRPR